MPRNDLDRTPQIYDARSVARLLPYGPLIDALDEAFRGGAVAPGRTRHEVEVPGSAGGTLLLMPAWRAGGVLGVKIATIFPGNLHKNLPSVHASYLVLDADTGIPAAILDGAELTARRTAAASALASRYLSRDDARSLLMVGAGKLAPHRPDMCEADGDAVSRAEVYVDTFAGALGEAGDIVQAMANGRLEESDIIGDLSGLSRGTCPPRRSRQAITLFKSVGTALEDLAAAELALRRAAQHG